MVFHIDWDASELRLCALSPVLRQICSAVDMESFTITPFVHALERLTTINLQEEKPYHYLIDAKYTGDMLSLNLHRTESYTSVVDTPSERLTKVLRPLLTPRETEIAILLFEGNTIRSIAVTLHIAEGTVKRTIFNIYQKMGVGSQVELVREIYVRLAECYAIP